MTQEFLESRHAAYRTPRQAIFTLIRRATGAQPLAVERIVRGFDNEVYAVTLAGDDACIVRIRRHGGIGFAEEAWAIGQAHAAGAPAPEILLLDMVDAEDGPREAMVQRRIAGRSLAALAPDLACEQWAFVLAQVGEALARVHSVRVDGFYRRNSDGTWVFPSWDRIMDSHIADRTEEAPLLLDYGFTKADTDEMLRLMELSRGALRTEQPVLCHGDVGPEHLLFDAQLRLTGLIDFGEFQGGIPLVDLASFHDALPAVDLHQMAAGYGDDGLFDSQLEQRLLLHAIGNRIGYLAHYIRTGVTPEIAPAVAGLRAAFEALCA